MSRNRSLAGAGLLAVASAWACVGGDSPTGLPRRSALSVVPTFADGVAQASTAQPITLVRLRVLVVPDDAVALEESIPVDPEATQWELALEIPLSSDPDALYVIEIELIHEGDGVSTVEWSGRTPPLSLGAGTATDVRQVDVVRGPLDNLAVTGLALEGPATVKEEESFTVVADVTTDGPANPTLFWSSLDPEIATVGPDGTGVALTAGVATIQAEAGAVLAVHEIVVLGPPAGMVVSPSSAELTAAGEEVAFTAEIRDRRDVALPDEEVTWSVTDARILEHLGDGRFRALAGGPTEVHASSVTDPELVGTAGVVVDLEIVEVVVTPADVTITAGSTEQMTAEAFAVGGVPVFGATFTWATSNELVAPVGSDGVVTGLYLGSAALTAAVEAVSGSAAVTVSEGVPHYATAGQTQLATGAFAPPATAHVYDADNVLAPTPGLLVNSTGTIPTAQEGTVELEADGDFSYVPPLGFQGTDSFDFSVESGETATVTIEVAGMVWYVHKGFTGVGLSTDPLNDGSLGGIGNPGDIIFVHHAGGALHDGGFTLLEGQQLLGEGYGLSLPGLGVIVPPGSPALIGGNDWDAIAVANDTRVAGVTITGAAGDAIAADGVGGVTVEDVRLDATVYEPGGIHLLNPTGSYTFTGLEIVSTSEYGFHVDGGDAQITVDLTSAGISGASSGALRVANTTGGSLSISGGPIVETGLGIQIESAAGDVEVLSPLQVVDPIGTGISISTSSGSVTLADIDVTTTNQTGIATTSNTGPITLVGSVNTTSAAGLDAQSVSGPSGPIDATFSSFVVLNDGGLNMGRGLFMERNPGVVEIDHLDVWSGVGQSPTAIDLLDMSYGGEFRVLDPTSSIVAAEGDALSITAGEFFTPGGQTYSVDVTLGTLESFGANTSSGGAAIALRGVDGSVAVSAGTIDKSGASVALTDGGTVALHYGGGILNATGVPVLVDGQLGGGITFGGPVSSTDSGIQITNNAAGTAVAFSGGVDLQTGANAAFTVTGGGQVEVTGSGNVISTTTGQGVLIDGTEIGPAGVTVQSVSVDGAPTGIQLVNTGALGGFAVTGTGDFSTGGVIANTTSFGVYASGTTGPSLSHLFVQAAGDAGVRLEGSTGVKLHDLYVEGAYADGVALFAVEDFTMTSSTIVGASELGSGVFVLDPSGSYLLDGVSVSDLPGEGMYVLASVGASSITVTGSSFDVSSQGVEVVTAGSADLIFWMSGSSASSDFEGVLAVADESSTLDFTLESSTLTAAVEFWSALVTSQQSGTVCVDIRDNTATLLPEGVLLQQLAGSTFEMERLLNGDGATNDPGVVESQIVADNPNLVELTNQAFIQDQIFGVPDGTCRLPGA